MTEDLSPALRRIAERAGRSSPSGPRGVSPCDPLLDVPSTDSPSTDGPSTGRPGRCSVRRVRTAPGFDALEPAWTALHHRCGDSPFQSFAWQRTWWRHYGESTPSAGPDILVVTEHRGDGRAETVAIAPFFGQRATVLGALPVRRLAMIGRRHSDYLDLLVDDASADRALEALAEHLAARRSEFDALVVTDLPDRSPTADRWSSALERAGLPCTRTVTDECPRIRFADTWEATLAALPPSTRGKMLRRQRQLVARHGAELELVEDPALVPAALAEFIALHQYRWTAAGQAGAFGDPRFAAFAREAIERLAGDGALVLAFLRTDGRRTAAVCGFVHRNEFFYYLGGLGDAGEAMRYSPGIALHLWCMQAMFERGIRGYDLLRGTESYKRDLGAEPHPTWTLTVSGRPGGLGRWPDRVERVQSRALNRLAHERALLRAVQERSRRGAPASPPAGSIPDRSAPDGSIPAGSIPDRSAPDDGAATVPRHLAERARVAWQDGARHLRRPAPDPARSDDRRRSP